MLLGMHDIEVWSSFGSEYRCGPHRDPQAFVTSLVQYFCHSYSSIELILCSLQPKHAEASQNFLPIDSPRGFINSMAGFEVYFATKSGHSAR